MKKINQSESDHDVFCHGLFRIGGKSNELVRRLRIMDCDCACDS